MSKAILNPPTFFRSATVREAPTLVDREEGIIHGFAVITRGEALGHDLWIDDEFIDQVAQFQSERGLKCRFTHPGLCADGTGKFLGRARGFERDGDRARADLHVSKAAAKSPSGDLADYVMTLAEEDPEAFGASIVFMRDREAEKAFSAAHCDDDGCFVSPDPKNTRNLTHARLFALKAVDVVDDPAANPDGFFASGEEFAFRADQLLAFVFGTKGDKPQSEWLGIDAERVKTHVTRYLDRNGLKVMNMSDKPAAATLDQLSERFTDPAFVLEQLKSGATMAEAERAHLLAENAKLTAELEELRAERNRHAAELAEREKAAAEAQAKLERMRDRGHAAIGAAETQVEEQNIVPGTEEAWRAEFAADPRLRAEFGAEGIEAYVAWKKNESNVRRLSGPKE